MEQCIEHGAGADDPKAPAKLKEAKLLLKKSKRKCLYSVLGIEDGSQDTTEEELRSAYKKQARLWHPDRHSREVDEEKKKAAEAKFKEISDASELLNDGTRRKFYDQGYDRDEIDQMVEMEKQRGGGGGGGHHGHGGHGGGGFPGFGFR